MTDKIQTTPPNEGREIEEEISNTVNSYISVSIENEREYISENDFELLKADLTALCTKYGKEREEKIKEKIFAIDFEKLLENTPHKVFYEPKYEGELFVCCFR